MGHLCAGCFPLSILIFPSRWLWWGLNPRSPHYKANILPPDHPTQWAHDVEKTSGFGWILVSTSSNFKTTSFWHQVYYVIYKTNKVHHVNIVFWHCFNQPIYNIMLTLYADIVSTNRFASSYWRCFLTSLQPKPNTRWHHCSKMVVFEKSFYIQAI